MVLNDPLAAEQGFTYCAAFAEHVAGDSGSQHFSRTIKKASFGRSDTDACAPGAASGGDGSIGMLGGMLRLLCPYFQCANSQSRGTDTKCSKPMTNDGLFRSDDFG
jgi:hypothetical protein